MFHGLGYTQMALSVILGSTVICERRFKPERVLDAIARAPADGARRRAGDALADRVGDRGIDPASGTRARCGSCSARARSSRRSSCGAPRRRSATSSTTSTGRPRSRTRRSRRPRTSAPRPGCAGQVPFGAVVKLYDFDGKPVARRRRDGPDLRRQRLPVRGLYRRRQQGDHRRADEHRRRRPLRRGRPAVHRWPRRRHDRLGRREPVPGRGRGAADHAPRGRRGRR